MSKHLIILPNNNYSYLLGCLWNNILERTWFGTRKTCPWCLSRLLFDSPPLTSMWINLTLVPIFPKIELKVKWHNVYEVLIIVTYMIVGIVTTSFICLFRIIPWDIKHIIISTGHMRTQSQKSIPCAALCFQVESCPLYPVFWFPVPPLHVILILRGSALLVMKSLVTLNSDNLNLLRRNNISGAALKAPRHPHLVDTMLISHLQISKPELREI